MTAPQRQQAPARRQQRGKSASAALQQQSRPWRTAPARQQAPAKWQSSTAVQQRSRPWRTCGPVKGGWEQCQREARNAEMHAAFGNTSEWFAAQAARDPFFWGPEADDEGLVDEWGGGFLFGGLDTDDEEEGEAVSICSRSHPARARATGCRTLAVATQCRGFAVSHYQDAVLSPTGQRARAQELWWRLRLAFMQGAFFPLAWNFALGKAPFQTGGRTIREVLEDLLEQCSYEAAMFAPMANAASAFLGGLEATSGGNQAPSVSGTAACPGDGAAGKATTLDTEPAAAWPVVADTCGPGTFGAMTATAVSLAPVAPLFAPLCGLGSQAAAAAGAPPSVEKQAPPLVQFGTGSMGGVSQGDVAGWLAGAPSQPSVFRFGMQDDALEDSSAVFVFGAGESRPPLFTSGRFQTPGAPCTRIGRGPGRMRLRPAKPAREGALPTPSREAGVEGGLTRHAAGCVVPDLQAGALRACLRSPSAEPGGAGVMCRSVLELREEPAESWVRSQRRRTGLLEDGAQAAISLLNSLIKKCDTWEAAQEDALQRERRRREHLESELDRCQHAVLTLQMQLRRSEDALVVAQASAMNSGTTGKEVVCTGSASLGAVSAVSQWHLRRGLRMTAPRWQQAPASRHQPSRPWKTVPRWQQAPARKPQRKRPWMTAPGRQQAPVRRTRLKRHRQQRAAPFWRQVRAGSQRGQTGAGMTSCAMTAWRAVEDRASKAASKVAGPGTEAPAAQAVDDRAPMAAGTGKEAPVKQAVDDSALKAAGTGKAVPARTAVEDRASQAGTGKAAPAKQAVDDRALVAAGTGKASPAQQAVADRALMAAGNGKAAAAKQTGDGRASLAAGTGREAPAKQAVVDRAWKAAGTGKAVKDSASQTVDDRAVKAAGPGKVAPVRKAMDGRATKAAGTVKAAPARQAVDDRTSQAAGNRPTVQPARPRRSKQHPILGSLASAAGRTTALWRILLSFAWAWCLALACAVTPGRSSTPARKRGARVARFAAHRKHVRWKAAMGSECGRWPLGMQAPQHGRCAERRASGLAPRGPGATFHGQQCSGCWRWPKGMQAPQHGRCARRRACGLAPRGPNVELGPVTRVFLST